MSLPSVLDKFRQMIPEYNGMAAHCPRHTCFPLFLSPTQSRAAGPFREISGNVSVAVMASQMAPALHHLQVAVPGGRRDGWCLMPLLAESPVSAQIAHDKSPQGRQPGFVPVSPKAGRDRV